MPLPEGQIMTLTDEQIQERLATISEKDCKTLLHKAIRLIENEWGDFRNVNEVLQFILE